jgi:deoxyribodipyrimidine photo-lyase
MTLRARWLQQTAMGPGPVLLWMSRDQRVADNHALALAQRLALDLGRSLAVVFGLAPGFLGATLRQYGFMLRGLAQVEERLRALGIPFFLQEGDPGVEVARLVHQLRAAAVVMDFSPLRLPRQWKTTLLEAVSVPVVEVDAHNVVPCWLASSKKEYAARTLRPKLWKLLSQFDDEPPPVVPHPITWPETVPPVDWQGVWSRLTVDRSVPEVDWCQPGEGAAWAALERFLAQGLPIYAAKRNDPNAGAQSRLSPYLHFGHIAPWRVFHEVRRSGADPANVDAFVEELVVRRELAENFCYYCPDYDSVEGFPEWARRSLEEHRADPRPALYDLHELEWARTADPLWNAAQGQLVRQGTMPGYLRMYWAKQLLLWTTGPEQALQVAIFLNDRYQLDGRDPNGYTGIAWSIGGVHDRPWFSRPIFGSVRPMTLRGCRSKFDVEAYIRREGGRISASPSSLARR